jgi:hypothetical protein
MTATLPSEVTGESPAVDLAERAARLRGRAIPATRVMLVSGGALLALGFALIVLGWLGAAHTVLLFEQVPYLLSGGLFGLGLVFVGAFTYFAYWQTLLVRDAREHNERVVAGLTRIEELLAAAALPESSSGPRSPSPSVRRRRNGSGVR